MARQNLLPNPNFSLSNGWRGREGATILFTHFLGRTCVEVTKKDTPNSGVETIDYIPIVQNPANLPYAYSAYIYIPTGQPSGTFVVSIEWYTFSSGTYTSISETQSDPTELSSGLGEWTRLTQVTAAPNNATHAKFHIYQTQTGTNEAKFLADYALFEQSSFVGGFIDNLTQAQETQIVDRALSIYEDDSHITKIQLNADVQIGDFVFNTIDEDQIIWICTDIEGWWNIATPETPNIPRGFQDGSYDVSGRYAARDLTLTGVFIPQGPGDVGVGRQKLLAAIDLVRQGAWLRTSEEPTRASFVRLTGRPQIQTVNARGRTEFSIALRAGDPIKYKWDDTKIDGISSQEIDLASEAPDDFGALNIINEGDATVTAKLIFTGPLGSGSTVEVYHENSGTTEVMTLIEPLRSNGAVATVTDVEITNNVALVTTEEAHGLSIGEVVSIVSTINDDVNVSSATISSVTDTLPYTLSYTITHPVDDFLKETSGGTVNLVSKDVMVVDNYHRNVTLNGDETGYRSKLDTLTDWITLEPGLNTFTFTDSIDPDSVKLKYYDGTTNKITLTTTDSHFLTQNNVVSIEFPTYAEIAFKEVTSNIITITTANSHGFSVGDQIEVSTTLSTTVTQKEITSNTATLTVADGSAISDNDVVSVSIPTTAQVIAKSRSEDLITLTTSNVATGHGFSNGDEVTVGFPVSALATNKQLIDGVATITTAQNHNFVLNDEINVAFPETTSINQKTVSDTQVTLRTATDHGFSVGDRITVALPTGSAVTLSDSRKYGGAAYLGVTFIQSSGVTRTLTTAAIHNFAAGDQIYVASINTDYNGTHTIINTPTTTTLTYDVTGGTSITNASPISTDGIGTVTNTTTSYRVTLNTAATHNFSVGDLILVGVGLPTTATITNRLASSTECTLTSAAHKYSVGEVITVALTGSGVGRYNGTFAISAVATDTFTYVFAGASESSTAATGSVTNLTIQNIYNGAKVIDTVPTNSSFTYLVYGQDSYTTSTKAGSSAYISNLTNTALNGTNLVLTAASGTTLQYTRTV